MCTRCVCCNAPIKPYLLEKTDLCMICTRVVRDTAYSKDNVIRKDYQFPEIRDGITLPKFLDDDMRE